MHREGQDKLVGWDDKLGWGGGTSLEGVMGMDKGRGGRDWIGKQFVSTHSLFIVMVPLITPSDQPSAV